MVGFDPKIRLKLSCESKKFKGPLYVIKPREVTTERMRSILGVDEEVKVRKRLDGATTVVKSETKGEE